MAEPSQQPPPASLAEPSPASSAAPSPAPSQPTSPTNKAEPGPSFLSVSPSPSKERASPQKSPQKPSHLRSPTAKLSWGSTHTTPHHSPQASWHEKKFRSQEVAIPSDLAKVRCRCLSCARQLFKMRCTCFGCQLTLLSALQDQWPRWVCKEVIRHTPNKRCILPRDIRCLCAVGNLVWLGSRDGTIHIVNYKVCRRQHTRFGIFCFSVLSAAME